MISDSYVFVTECLYLYNSGMRQAVKLRLEETYGQEWWTKGVEIPFMRYRRDPDIQWQLDYGLGVGLYPPIIKANINKAFKDVFPDPEEAHWNLLKIRDVRNDWAHHREVTIRSAQRVAGWMIDILEALERAEARSIEELIEEYGFNGRATGEEKTTMEGEGPSAAEPKVREVVRTLQRQVRAWWNSKSPFKRFARFVD